MFTLGGHERRVGADGWTVATADGSLAAHWEHTIAVTADGPRILTLSDASPPTERSVGTVGVADGGPHGHQGRRLPRCGQL